MVRCLWHPKLNQIMVGTGNGLAKVYYDPNKSQRYFIGRKAFEMGDNWAGLGSPWLLFMPL